jgi:hypothetical protein
MLLLSSFRVRHNSLISLPKLPQSNLMRVALGSFLLLFGVHEFGGEGEVCIWILEYEIKSLVATYARAHPL